MFAEFVASKFPRESNSCTSSAFVFAVIPIGLKADGRMAFATPRPTTELIGVKTIFDAIPVNLIV